jgi:hypothetical protein
VDSNLLAVREGEMRHMSAMALVRVWCGDRHGVDKGVWMPVGVRACDLKPDGDLILEGETSHAKLPSCPDCAVLRDYAEENASAT